MCCCCCRCFSFTLRRRGGERKKERVIGGNGFVDGRCACEDVGAVTPTIRRKERKQSGVPLAGMSAARCIFVVVVVVVESLLLNHFVPLCLMERSHSLPQLLHLGKQVDFNFFLWYFDRVEMECISALRRRYKVYIISFVGIGGGNGRRRLGKGCTLLN